MEIEVNFVAVLAASIASMALGFLWYSPAILGVPWMKLKGFSKESLKSAQKEMGKLYMLSFVMAIISAFVLSHVMALSQSFYGYPKFQTGLNSAFWMWLGFVMPVQVTATIFGDNQPAGRQGKWGLFGIDTGYQLVSLLVMGIVMGMM